MKVDFTDPVKLGNAPYHRGTRPCKPAEHLERLRIPGQLVFK